MWISAFSTFRAQVDPSELIHWISILESLQIVCICLFCVFLFVKSRVNLL